MDPEEHDEEEEKQCQAAVTKNKKDNDFRWFQATNSNQMVCTSLQCTVYMLSFEP